MTTKLLIGAIVLAFSATALANDRSIHNANHVLGMGRAQVVSLCRANKGTWSDPTCVFDESANVFVNFEKGVADTHGMLWDNPGIAVELLMQAKRVMGEPDIKTPSGDCAQYWWIDVDDHTFMLQACPYNTGWITTNAK